MCGRVVTIVRYKRGAIGDPHSSDVFKVHVIIHSTSYLQNFLMLEQVIIVKLKVIIISPIVRICLIVTVKT